MALSLARTMATRAMSGSRAPLRPRSRPFSAEAAPSSSSSTTSSTTTSSSSSSSAPKAAAPPGSPLVKWVVRAFGLSTVGGAAGLAFWLGRPFDAPADKEADASGHNVSVSYNNYDDENAVKQYFFRARDRVTEAWNLYGNPPPAHLLPPPAPQKLNDYVLVLTVEDLLIHQDWTPLTGWRTVKRPHLDMFLAYCYNLFGEVVLFSDKNVIESVGVVMKLDPENMAHKLYRGHQKFVQGEYIKDISQLDRDMSKVLVLDVSKDGFRLQPHNGLTVSKFHNDPSDRVLLELIPLLQAIVKMEVPDIREVVKNFGSVEDITAALSARRHAAAEAARLAELQREEEAAFAPSAPVHQRGRLARWLIPK